MPSKPIVMLSIVILVFAFMQFRRYIPFTSSILNKYRLGLSGLAIIIILGCTAYSYTIIVIPSIAAERIISTVVLLFGSLYVLLSANFGNRAFEEIMALEEESNKYREQLKEEISNRAEALKEFSIADGTSGLYSKQYLYRKLGEEIVRSKRQRIPLHLIMFDTDDTGQRDTLPQVVGEIIVSNIRDKIDSGFDCGNGRFAAILPCTVKEPAISIARRILLGLNAREINISMGLVSCNEIGSSDAIELIKVAGIAISEAKAEGGNRIRLLEKNQRELPDNSQSASRFKKIKHLRRLK